MSIHWNICQFLTITVAISRVFIVPLRTAVCVCCSCGVCLLRSRDAEFVRPSGTRSSSRRRCRLGEERQRSDDDRRRLVGPAASRGRRRRASQTGVLRRRQWQHQQLSRTTGHSTVAESFGHHRPTTTVPVISSCHADQQVAYDSTNQTRRCVNDTVYPFLQLDKLDKLLHCSFIRDSH